MSYYDLPDEFLGCPCCFAPEEKVIEQDNSDLICSECHTNLEWASENTDKWTVLPEDYYDRSCGQCGVVMEWSKIHRVNGIYDEIYICCANHKAHYQEIVEKQARDERIWKVEAIKIKEEASLQEAIDRGWIDPITMKATNEYFVASDHAYAVSRGK